MAFDKSFSDEIKKEIAYKEYEIESYNQDVRLKTGEYIGNVAHIYDNVNDNEEQVFVLTNNGQGEKQKVDEGLEQAQKSKAQLDTDLEALEKVLQTVPKGFILNLAEVEEAYAQAGATRQTIVTEVRERFDDRLAAYQSLSNEFHTLNEQVNAGIELLKTKDQEIAGEMNQWEQLAY